MSYAEEQTSGMLKKVSVSIFEDQWLRVTEYAQIKTIQAGKRHSNNKVVRQALSEFFKRNIPKGGNRG